jgi:hypothetical protein
VGQQTRGRRGHASIGLAFRVQDQDNFFFAYAYEGVLKVGYYLNGVRTELFSQSFSINWVMLRVITKSTGLIEVHVEECLLYSTSNPILSTSTKAGLYNNGAGMVLRNRWDEFTVLATP